MIEIKSIGDMGNQIFQYAFGYCMSRKLNTTFCLNHFHTLTNFTLGGDTPFANGCRKAAFKAQSLLRRPADHDWQDFNAMRYASPEAVLGQLTDHAIYRGYFQSHRFFTGNESEVKALFTARPDLVAHFEKSYSSYLTGKPLAILHIRGKGHGGWDDIRLPQSYYLNCIARVKNPGDYRWIAMTDDIDFARTRLPADLPVEFVSGTVLDDFQLMQHAAVHIMANSTFSWWAAYLNRNPQAHIMGPFYWYGHRAKFRYEAPEGIMNPAWDWVEAA